MMIMYVGIFVAITFMTNQANSSTPQNTFEASKCRVMLIDKDQSDLSKELVNYIESNTTPVEIKQDENSLRDALFFRDADFIGTIPEGFEEDFLAGKEPQLTVMQIPGSMGSTMVENMFNSYLSIAHTYFTATDKMDYKAIAASMDQEVSVTIKDNKTGMDLSSANYYFNYLVYPLLAILIFCVSFIMQIINEVNVKRRNACSPVKALSFQLQTFLANLVFASVVFVIFIALSIFMFPDNVFSTQGFFWILNTLVLTVVCLSLSFMIGNVATKDSVGAISNSVSLGACFLGGVFVPLEFLSEGVKNVSALVNPAFWFVKTNNLIGSMSVFNAKTLAPIYQGIFIEIGFAAAFLAIALVLIKYKRTAI